jgi:magnesium-protoporphyrin O-methyltransferase
MPTCSDCDGYARLFDENNARRDVKRYQKGGLDATGRELVNRIVERGVVGATVLEVGGGIGAVQIELMRAGASTTTNVEIVGTYESEARKLLDAEGLTSRVNRKVLDFAKASDQVPAADIVVLHRVVCCYPAMEPLVHASAAHANRMLALTFPSDRWWWRIAALFLNVWFAAQRSSFRAHLHEPKRILAAAMATGLRPVFERRGLVWQAAVLERPP